MKDVLTQPCLERFVLSPSIKMPRYEALQIAYTENSTGAEWPLRGTQYLLGYS